MGSVSLLGGVGDGGDDKLTHSARVASEPEMADWGLVVGSRQTSFLWEPGALRGRGVPVNVTESRERSTGQGGRCHLGSDLKPLQASQKTLVLTREQLEAMKDSRQRGVWSDSCPGKFTQTAVWRHDRKEAREVRAELPALGRWADSGGTEQAASPALGDGLDWQEEKCEGRWTLRAGTVGSETTGFGTCQPQVQVRLFVFSPTWHRTNLT